MIDRFYAEAPQAVRTDPASEVADVRRPGSLFQQSEKRADEPEDQSFYRPTPPPIWPRVFPGL